LARPRERRFRRLAAPFQGDRRAALHKTQERTREGNNTKGNLFHPHAAAPAKAPVRRFAREED